MNGNLRLVTMFVEHGADVNAYDVGNATAVWMAAYNGHAKVINYLAGKGAFLESVTS